MKSRVMVEVQRTRMTRWSITLIALGWLLGFTVGPAQASNSVSGEAFGVSVNVGPLVVPKTPDVVLPPGGGMVEAQVLSISVPGTLVSKTLTVTTSGAIGASTASAQSSSTVEQVDLLNGLVKARLV